MRYELCVTRYGLCAADYALVLWTHTRLSISISDFSFFSRA